MNNLLSFGVYTWKTGMKGLDSFGQSKGKKTCASLKASSLEMFIK